jgi:integrative and conjugative element protein (TIGR02256 family)
MKLLLPGKIRGQWINALRSAGRREIGGVLLGELIKPGTFKILEITIQRSGGTLSHFVRDPKLHEKSIEAFFERTKRDYGRYNYLGEWHSHPSFSTRPSFKDIRSMYRIVSEPSVGALFATLVIIRLASHSNLELSACAFRSGVPIEEVEIYREHTGSKIANLSASWINALRRRLRLAETDYSSIVQAG